MDLEFHSAGQPPAGGGDRGAAFAVPAERLGVRDDRADRAHPALPGSRRTLPERARAAARAGRRGQPGLCPDACAPTWPISKTSRWSWTNRWNRPMPPSRKRTPGMRNSVAVVIGTIYYMEGDFAAAMRYFRRCPGARQAGERHQCRPDLRPCAWPGCSRRRAACARPCICLSEQEAYVRERGSRRFYIAGAINLLWGEILLEWNRLDEAESPDPRRAAPAGRLAISAGPQPGVEPAGPAAYRARRPRGGPGQPGTGRGAAAQVPLQSDFSRCDSNGRGCGCGSPSKTARRWKPGQS